MLCSCGCFGAVSPSLSGANGGGVEMTTFFSEREREREREKERERARNPPLSQIELASDPSIPIPRGRQTKIPGINRHSRRGEKMEQDLGPV